MRSNYKGIYLLLFGLCASTSALISLSQLLGIDFEISLKQTQYFFMLLFSLDFGLRLFHSPNKKSFVLRHCLEVTAIYPVCLLYLPISIIGVCAMSFHKFKAYFKSRKLIAFFLLIGIVILLSSFCLYQVEYGKSVTNLFDAIWLCVVTVTTVGYGDIAPQTTLGKIILMVLMFFGVLFVGVVTTIMTGYLHRGERFSKRKLVLKSIRSILENLSTEELSEIDRKLTERYKK